MKINSYYLPAALLLAAWAAPGPVACAQAPARAGAPTALPAMPSDEQSYRREVVYGLNLNSQGALIGGAVVRSSRVLDERWLRFWSIEGVMYKNPKEQEVQNRNSGGTFIYHKSNYAFALRPSYGLQRVLFRKAAESGVQVNALVSAGPSIGILLPYHIYYNRASSPSSPEQLSDEQYDPTIHREEGRIWDKAPLFSGIGQTSFVPGVHLRGGISFEYGRYRDAVAGLEAGFILEAYTKRLIILKPTPPQSENELNKQFFPAVYFILYLGHRG